MVRRSGIAMGLIAALLTGCVSSPVRIAPPRVAQGGRALSISVASNNDQRMIVATETGGLFRTYDGGKSWQHLDGLPNYQTIDVAHASLAPETIIATAQSQYRTLNDGGIWRSTDGGGSWNQPPGWAPPPGPGCPNRPGAYGISHMPLTRTFYVGTDCGLSVSQDDGATWSHIVLDPNAAGSDSLQHRVRSVLVINRTSGVAAADRGLWYIDSNGTWTKAQDVETSGQVPVTHAFAAPYWLESSIFYHASGGQKLWVSSDAGATWSRVPAPSNNVREAFVRVARSITGNESEFDVYFGDGVRLRRQTFSTDALAGTGTWIHLQSDHEDPADIAFDLSRQVPILLATDGGVHRTANQGANWTLTGGGYGGFTALQISEVAGQELPGPPPHLVLYYGTQDNDIKGSIDGGQSWTGSVCCEGRFIRVSSGGIDYRPRVTGQACGPCYNFVAAHDLSNTRAWPNAPDGSTGNQADAPFLIAGDTYLQYVYNPQTPSPTYDYYLTSTAGASWSSAFSLTRTPKGAAVFAGSAANPTMYQGVLLPGSLPDGGFRFGLMRATDLAGQVAVHRADSSGIGAFGSLRTPIARYVVFGVDPINPNHLIAPDVETREMKFSADGGVTWFPVPQLTQAVTDNGKYLFQRFGLPLASVIAWDPYDSCHILVGTMQNGVIRSTDGGNSWARIDGSKPLTYVSSFYFPPTGPVWASTNGRGLWTLRLDRRSGEGAGRCRFPSRPPRGFEVDSLVAVQPITGAIQAFRGLDDPLVCARCSVVVVRNGWVTDLRLSGETVQEIAISGGTISQLDRSGREIPLAVPNVYRPGDGRFERRIPGRGLAGSRRILALVLEGLRLSELIAAGVELPFAPPRTPMLFVHGASEEGGPPVVMGGKPLRVIGTDFLPASRGGEPVSVLFDSNVVARDVRVRADGSFSLEIPLQHLRGEMVVTAEQRDGLRLTTEKAIVDVLTEDREQTEPAP